MTKPPTARAPVNGATTVVVEAPGIRRISVPLDAETRRVFQSMADAGGMSLAKAIAEWLKDTLDAAQQVGTMMAEARARPKLVARQLGAMALGLQEEVRDVQSLIRTKGRPGGIASAGASGLPPRPVIRGGKPGKTLRGG